MDSSTDRITAVGVSTITDDVLIENMTYDDYLSSVYTYEEACADSSKAQSDAEAAAAARDKLKAELEEMQQQDDANRREYDAVVAAEVKKKKDVWQKSQARFDFKLSNRKAVAQQTAKNDIQSKKDEFDAAVKKAQEQEKTLTRHLKELDDAYQTFKEQQKKFNNFTGRSFPPSDPDALAVLERARDKGLLTKFQLEMLDGDVNKICDTWISGFDGLVQTEDDFSHSEFYRKLVDGNVSKKIHTKIANISAAVFTALLLITVLLLFSFPPNAVSFFIKTAISTLALGGVFSSVVHLLYEKLESVRSLPIKYKILAVTGFVVGCIPGVLIGIFAAAPSQSIGAVIWSVLSAFACGMLFRRFLLTGFSGGVISKLAFAKDMERKKIFSEYESLENGKYNFMIFCYLKHDHVLTYLSMLYSQNEISSLQERITFNRKDVKYYTEQLEYERKRLGELKNKKGGIALYEKERMTQLADEIEAIESERPAEPDFEEEARKSLADKLTPLDVKHKLLSDKIAGLENELSTLEDKCRASSQKAFAAREQKKRIAQALRQWKKTPMPASTDYRLLDAMCIDSRSKLTIVHHDLKPYVLRYSPKVRSDDPSETLAMFIYRYIRGLCKINPRRLMQINIFDYVSDPRILVETPSFHKLSDRGVIEGIYSMKEFEIRLFPNSEGYSTFKDLFRLQCSRVSAVLKEHREEIPEGVRPDLALANRLNRDDGELFLYQVCIFVVPREEDSAVFHPPKGILELIDRGSYMRLGILPVFIADSDSISHEWRPVLDKYGCCDYIFPLN